ncbi:argininosuccinate synthase, partial [Fusobacterium necrophorum]
FELGIKALAPEMKIIAPWRIWNLQSRSDEIAYLEKHGIDLPFPSKKHSYSQDENLFHISHEGNELEQPEKEPNYSNFLKFISPL